MLEAKSLTPTLKARFNAADVNGDGVLSADELVQVFESEIKARRDRKLLQRLIIALGAACVLVVAAVVGLTYAVVNFSKDTSVDGTLFVSKESNIPLATSNVQYHLSLADLYKLEDAVMLQSLEQVVVPFGSDGTTAVFHVTSVKFKPGVMVEIATFHDGVAIVVNETGVVVLGGPPSAATGGNGSNFSYSVALDHSHAPTLSLALRAHSLTRKETTRRESQHGPCKLFCHRSWPSETRSPARRVSTSCMCLGRLGLFMCK